MSTTSNQILWAVRGIEDTETLRTALVEIERVIYHLAGNEELLKAASSASDSLYALIKALPEANTSTIDGTLIEVAGA